MHYFGTGYGMGWGLLPFAGLALVLIMAWSFIWKGLALWRAAHRGEVVWFIVFLLVNTAGILEIIYLFFIAKDKKLRDMLGMNSHEHHNHTA
jgi:methionyl-tRNA synthetase